MDHLEFALEIEFGKIAHRSEPGVIDQHLDLEFALLCFFKELRRRVGLLQIERDVLCANAGQASSSLHKAISLSSERATRRTFRPRAASFRAKAAPIPEDAPVMRVVFITNRNGSLQLKQIELDDVSVACLKFLEGFFCWRIVQIDASNGRRRAFEDDILHLLNVDLFCLDRVEHAGEYARPIEMTDDESMRCRSLSRQIYNVRHLPVSLNSFTMRTVSAAIASCAWSVDAPM